MQDELKKLKIQVDLEKRQTEQKVFSPIMFFGVFFRYNYLVASCFLSHVFACSKVKMPAGIFAFFSLVG